MNNSKYITRQILDYLINNSLVSYKIYTNDLHEENINNIIATGMATNIIIANDACETGNITTTYAYTL